MELKISCDASVKLKRINTIKTIDCNVIDFEVIKDTLNGNIKINGSYIKDDLEKIYEFEELVPFTVVFRDDDFIVEEIVCGNFSYQEIVNQGIECHFDVFITYRKKNEVKTPLKEKIVIEKVPEKEIKVEEVKEIEITDTETAEPVVKSDEQISQHYDEMLQELLEKRNDNFLEEEKEEENEIVEEEIVEEEIVEEEIEKIIPKKNLEITIGKQEKKEKADSLFKNAKESYKTVTVYYLHSESEVDKICQKEKLNINDVYEDFTKNRRIIVK